MKKLYDIAELQDDTIKLTLSRLLQKGHRDAGEMPIYMFNIRRLDGVMVGQCNLLAGHDPKMYYTGNIGYGVWECYRGQHYGLRAARLLVQFAKELGMTEVYLLIDTDNIASIRIAQHLGAENLGIVEVPSGNLEYLKGSRQKYRYRLQLT